MKSIKSLLTICAVLASATTASAETTAEVFTSNVPETRVARLQLDNRDSLVAEAIKLGAKCDSRKSGRNKDGSETAANAKRCKFTDGSSVSFRASVTTSACADGGCGAAQSLSAKAAKCFVENSLTDKQCAAGDLEFYAYTDAGFRFTLSYADGSELKLAHSVRVDNKRVKSVRKGAK